MSNSKRSGSESVPLTAGASKRVILSMGGKGGVGKTSVMAGLAEWFDTNQIPVKLLESRYRKQGERIPDALFRRPRAQGEHSHTGWA